MSVNCPKCGNEMSEEFQKFNYNHAFGTAEATVKNRTKRAWVFHCKDCKKYFAPSLQLVEVKLA